MNIGTLTFCTLLCVKGRLQNQFWMSKCAQSTNMPSSLLKYSLGHCTHDKRTTVKCRKFQQNVYPQLESMVPVLARVGDAIPWK